MRRRLAALGVALAIVVLASGVVLAASKTIPNDGVFYACYDSGGAVKFIDYSVTQTCPKSWTGPVTWNQSGLIGIKNFEMNSDNVEFTAEDGTTVLSLWAETGSNKQECLASISETRTRVSPSALYCASRTLQFTDGTSHAGVYLHLFLLALPDPDFAYWVNVYQEGAKFYGEPMRCDLPGCNE